MEEAPVAEVVSMDEVRPVERVTMCEAVSAAMEDGRRTKTATVDRHPTTSETTAVKGRAATAEAAAMERGTAASESTAMKPAAAETTTAAAAETTAATAAETAAATAAMLNLGRQSVGCVFC
ncbi:hypothetical protein IVB22_18985 [Bradyrhizobium sp. 190]|uniref:hypothetical protein n=1 Tax=Bradyrhizobium sp. 190 TaxID=2782658 RepID=UPI0027DEC30C|nr:hypothetical protein [Bradyrhizobium sp. 190]MCK1514617.1 hypothetical protein [Bradyrhizobium sp. 190]